MSEPRPLLIVGIDGGDPGFLRRWAAEGHLPALARLMRAGRHGTTGGPELVTEHGVWVSIATGVSRGRTGFHYFRQLDPGTYRLHGVTGRSVGIAPFWSGLRGGRGRAVILDVPDVYPVPGVAGVQLSNWAPHLGWATRDPAYQPMAEPPAFLAEADRIAGKRGAVLEKNPSTPAEDLQIYRRLRARVEAKGELLRQTLKQAPWSLAVVVFGESHTAGHQFWDYRPESPHPRGETAPELRTAIRDIYAAIDRELATFLEQAPEANVVVVSSIGMTDHHPTAGLMEAFCRRLGYEVPAPPRPVSLNPLSLARRCVPEPVRVALSRHLPRDTREQLLSDAFEGGTDWSRTVAFAVPAFYSSYLRVNLKGREPQGIVSPGQEYDDVLDRLTADIRALVDPVTQSPAVEAVFRTRELFGPDVHPALPDLFVHWHPKPYFLECVVHPRAELVQPPQEFRRTSDHSHTGFVCFSGPDVLPGQGLGTVDVLDLAPTFLRLLGEREPYPLAGRPLEAVLAA